MDSLSSQLQQLRSELAAEQDFRAAEASTAAAAAQRLAATIKSLQESSSRVSKRHCRELNHARAKNDEQLNQALPWQQEYEAAVHRSIALEAEAKKGMDSLSSQLQQLCSELATEQDLRAEEASKAAAAQDALSSTVKSLEEEASRVATVHCKELHDATAMIHALQKEVSGWREQYEAVHKSMASEAEAKKGMDSLS